MLIFIQGDAGWSSTGTTGKPTGIATHAKLFNAGWHTSRHRYPAEAGPGRRGRCCFCVYRGVVGSFVGWRSPCRQVVASVVLLVHERTARQTQQWRRLNFGRPTIHPSSAVPVLAASTSSTLEESRYSLSECKNSVAESTQTLVVHTANEVGFKRGSDLNISVSFQATHTNKKCRAKYDGSWTTSWWQLK